MMQMLVLVLVLMPMLMLLMMLMLMLVLVLMLMLVIMHMPMQMLMVWMVVVVAITKPQFRHCQAITKPTLAITKRLPSPLCPLWPLPSHYQAPFGHYQATTKPRWCWCW